MLDGIMMKIFSVFTK